MHNKIKVLVVDDEPQIRRFLTIGLKHDGYAVEEAENGASAIRLCRAIRPDIILLDLGLPDIDGQKVIETLRRESFAVPIMVLSVRNDASDIIAALDTGADDYLTKPFGMDELQARLRSLKRRAVQVLNGGLDILEIQDLKIDLARHEVSLKNSKVNLSPKEFKILHELACHANKVLTHRHLLIKVWGPAQAQEHQYLRVYMGQLRKKLSVNGKEPTYIRTLQGVGYIFDTTTASQYEMAHV
jgi:two-component system KDP operon response regulator KdpE